MRVRDALGPLFSDEDFTAGEFEEMYADLGRPGISPALLVMVTVLQFLHNLSDRDAAVAVADRISWKYALGLELEYTGFDASVLCEFRARLASGDRADALLSLMLERLKAAGLVRSGGRQRTDSTHVLACVRRLNRIECLGEALRAALEEIARTSPGLIVPLLGPGWDERYGRKVETSRLLRRKNASAARLAEQIGADGQSLIAAIDADATAGWMNDLPQVKIMRELWDQHFEATGTGQLRYRDTRELPPSAQRIRSPHEIDARYSTKGTPGADSVEWTGSKGHLTESCDEDLPNLVTDVHTTCATEPDVSATTPIQDKLIDRDLKPGEHLTDSGYPTGANIGASLERGITLIAPVTIQTGRGAHNGTFTPKDFHVDWQAGVTRCPAGATSISMRPKKNGLIRVAFSRAHCRPCPIRAQCTSSAPHLGRSLEIHPEPIHTARMRMQTEQDSPEWRETYRVRAGIEGTVSQAVRGPGLRRSRYRGLAKTHLQNVLIGIAINIRRLGAHYDTTTRSDRRPTRIHALCTQHGIATTA
ncbi:IS1182 family transposase [Streptomyces kaniharaensis]|uniref:IS1182 family transposase n=1 Tax=Streptomyces kaniharaensis TaxID=212423 RepID=A0A6N7L1S4_9ACTN|nr:IS1182 family transposase [Streptomyces kaniharaensis]MQS17710.1 IS1182 family transposase [Streptomyces kaniharaensis]